jgi:predicted O-linked N-acetylglucosamine transferase (SPINDLY family)
MNVSSWGIVGTPVQDASQAFQEALGCYQAGRQQAAARLCEEVICAAPSHADAWHLLGLIEHEAGNQVCALAHVQRAIELHGANPAHYNTLGLCLAARNETRAAAEKFRLATLLAPAFAEAHANLGAALRALCECDKAKACLERALAIKPDLSHARYTLAQLCRSLGLLDEAEAEYRQLLKIDPNYPGAQAALASVCSALNKPFEQSKETDECVGAGPERRADRASTHLASGRIAEALEEARLALLERPGFPAALSAQGMALWSLGQTIGAEESLRAAIQAAPGLFDARHQLGVLLLESGRAAEAVDALSHLVQIAPKRAETHVVLVRALQAVGRHDDADRAWRKAVLECPNRIELLIQLAALLADQGDIGEAQTLTDGAAGADPSPQVRLVRATFLPPILGSCGELENRREALARELTALSAAGLRVEPSPERLPLLFYLAHQGRNDRVIHEAYARVVASPSFEPLAPRRPRAGRKLRVGFFSTRFRDHTIGRLNQGTIARLPRRELEVVVLSDIPHGDAIGRFIADSADEYRITSRDARAARVAIAAAALDILIYTDLGMDSLTYALACTRLAPIQCVTWGHPATSGLDTIDYFLSSELLDTPEAQEHYTERLVRLPSLPIYYYRPVISPLAKDRRALGLPIDGNLYACPQMLFKIHPEFDDILGQILRQDRAGYFVLLEGQHPRWRKLLFERFQRAIPDVLNRIVFLPQLPVDEFLALNAAVDVLLDPIHFGGGNTSYEAFAVGTPVVTLPSGLLKGRITQALYRQMGVSSCLAATGEEYVEIATRLGTDPDSRSEVKEAILAAHKRIFENESGLLDLETFLLRAQPVLEANVG